MDRARESVRAEVLRSQVEQLAVSDVAAAEAAIRLLKDDDAGRAALLVGTAPESVDRSAWPALPDSPPRRIISPASNAAKCSRSWAGVVMSNARRTFPIAVTIGAGASP